jgi:hypothetical protein
MAITFHFLSASGALHGEFKTRVHAALEVCVQTCSAKLVLGDLDVVVMAAPKFVIPQLGVNGYSYDAHQILLQLDPDHDSLAQNLEHRVSALLAHELHHCARFLACSGLTGTFGDALVSEGLACCFEEEIVLCNRVYGGHFTPICRKGQSACRCALEPVAGGVGQLDVWQFDRGCRVSLSMRVFNRLWVD